MSLSSSSVGALARAGSGPLGRPPSGAWRPGSPSGWKPWAAREVNNWPSSEQGGRDDAFLRPDTKCDASSWPEQPGSPARLLRALAPASQPPRPPVVAPGIKSKAIIRTCLIQTGAKVTFDCVFRLSATSRGGRLWERGRTIILARGIRPCRMLRPTCVPFKYYNNQSRQGLNIAA